MHVCGAYTQRGQVSILSCTLRIIMLITAGGTCQWKRVDAAALLKISLLVESYHHQSQQTSTSKSAPLIKIEPEDIIVDIL